MLVATKSDIRNRQARALPSCKVLIAVVVTDCMWAYLQEPPPAHRPLVTVEDGKALAATIKAHAFFVK